MAQPLRQPSGGSECVRLNGCKTSGRLAGTALTWLWSFADYWQFVNDLGGLFASVWVPLSKLESSITNLTSAAPILPKALGELRLPIGSVLYTYVSPVPGCVITMNLYFLSWLKTYGNICISPMFLRNYFCKDMVEYDPDWSYGTGLPSKHHFASKIFNQQWFYIIPVDVI